MITFQENLSEHITSQVLNILPENIPTLVVSVKVETDETDGRLWLCCNVRVSLRSKEEALGWLKRFEEKTLTVYNVDSTFPENTLKLVFKKKYLCHHNTKATYSKSQQPHAKHTGCTARLTITVKQQKMKRSKDKHLKVYPGEVDIRFTHNHPLDSPDLLKHRYPATEVENTFSEYFFNGHSPSSALETFKADLRDGVKYHTYHTPDSKYPSKKWCSDLYYKIFKKQYGEPSGEEIITSLKNAVDCYNKTLEEECAVLREDPLIIAICSPLMKKVHQLKESQEMIFVNSSGNMQKHNSRVFLFLCLSPAGPLPLGIVVTFSETENIIYKGIEMLKSLYNIKKIPPEIIITNSDSASERIGLQMAFPETHLLLCKFHILQNVWRYLKGNKHEIYPDHPQDLYRLFKITLNSKTKESFEKNFQEMFSSPLTNKYKKFKEYLMELKECSAQWGMYGRNDLLTGNTGNNYNGATMEILKDKIVKWTKDFSIVQLFDYLTKNYECYYEKKLTDLIIENIVEAKDKDKQIEGMICTQINESKYEVATNNGTYDVNHSLRMCSCPKGKTGTFCTHQYAVKRNFNLFKKSIPMDSEFKDLLYFIAPDAVFSDSDDVDIVPTPENLELKNDLGSVYTILKNKLETDPQVFEEPVQYFVDALKNMSTSELTSALNNFGKPKEPEAPIEGKNKRKLEAVEMMDVQTNSPKKFMLVKVKNVGKPVKRSYPYKNKSRENSLETPVRLRKIAPRPLQASVTENVGLGK